MPSSPFVRALARAEAGDRLSRNEAAALARDLNPDSLAALGAAAHTVRTARHGNRATYVCNLHINPSNVCVGGCSFCRFAVPSADDPRAYSLSEEDILADVADLNPAEVHIVGGLNDIWPFERNRDLVKALRAEFPGLFIKAFDAVEIDFFARTSGRTPEAVLTELAEAGVDALPGGGAEVFSERLRRDLWPEKIDSARWLSIHAAAHSLGIPTNATLLFGIGETWQERIDHLLALRDAQEDHPGFVCFIPLAFRPGAQAAAHEKPNPFTSLAILALSRLILDNFAHIKSYWPSLGTETAAAGLAYGADDMDGTLTRERVMHAAGSPAPRGLARRRMAEMIRLAGFEPVERDGRFRPMTEPGTTESGSKRS